MTRRDARYVYIVRFAALAAVAEMVWMTWSHIRHGLWVDSDVYAMGGMMVREGGDLYSARTAEKLPFTYSPFAAVLFVPLSLLEPDVARLLFTMASLACLAVVIRVISRRLALDRWRILVLAGVSLASEPMLSNLLLGQVNLVLMALVVVDWLLLPRRYRGYLTGIAAGIKITPAAFMVLAVLRRDWGVMARAGAGLLGSVVLGWLIAPSASGWYWGGGFMGLGKFGSEAILRSDNQSLLGAWMRMTGTVVPSEFAQVTALVAGMSLGIAAATVELRRGQPHSDVAAVSWIALGSLLGSPISWTHHWVWFILVLSILLARHRYAAVAITSLIYWYPMIWLNSPGEFRELLFGPPQRVLSCAYVITGITMLTVVFARYTGRRRGRARQPEIGLTTELDTIGTSAPR